MANNDEISRQQALKMQRAFAKAVASIKDSTKLGQLEALIERGDIDGIIKLLGLEPATFEPLKQAIEESYRTAGAVTADIIGDIPLAGVGSVAFRFDMTAPAAIEWIRKESSRLIVEVTEQQKQLVRDVIAAGTENGDNPRTQALGLVGRLDATGERVGGFIGLTDQQAQWVSNARRDLYLLTATTDEIADWFNTRGIVQPENYNPSRSYMSRALRDKRFDATIRKAIAEGKPIPAAKIKSAITSMQNRALKYRGDVIGRTESINALRAGQEQAILQMINKGDIEASDVTKIWDATGDSRTRPEHLIMESNYKDGIPFNQNFIFPTSFAPAKYPGDDSMGATGGDVIQCRCMAVYNVDYIGRALRIRGFR